MTITLTYSMLWWLIPIVPSLIWLIWAIWPKGSGPDSFGIGAIFNGFFYLLGLAPVLIIWIIFLALK